MSVTITTDVFCDECGRWDHYRCGEKAFVRDAQRAAVRAGWLVKVTTNECMCPECNGSKAKYSYWGHNSEPHTLR